MAKQHPVYEMAFHIPNERKASIARRVTLKKAGVRKGVPDICCPVPNNKYAGLYIEMKIKPNRPSPEQLEMIRRLNDLGNYAIICWSAEDAIQIMKNYVKGLL